MPSVTARRSRKKPGGQQQVTLSFSGLPGREFTFEWPEAVGQVEFAALVPRVDARGLVFRALTNGDARMAYETETERDSDQVGAAPGNPATSS